MECIDWAVDAQCACDCLYGPYSLKTFDRGKKILINEYSIHSDKMMSESETD